MLSILFAIPVVLWFFLPQCLIEQDAPERVDAIVVIGGDHKPERVKHAIDLFQQGYAPIVIISAGTLVLEGDERMPEAEVMRRQSAKLGLPENAILIEDKSQSTYENAEFVKPLLEKRDAKKVLLVTSLFHSRRAKQIFQDVFASKIAVSVQPARPEAPSALWMFYPDNLYVVFYEYKNWLLYWIGR